MNLPYPPLIILPMDAGLEKMVSEEPFASHPEFEVSARQYGEFGFYHPQLGWLRVLLSESIRPKLEWTLLDMELKAKQKCTEN